MNRGLPVMTVLAIAAALPLAACSGAASDSPASGNGFSLERLVVDDRLRAMGPDGWHRIALYANWDFTEPEVWTWIVSQPSCDRATALAIFWKAQPEYYLEFATAEDVEAINRDGFALTTLIRERWLADSYTRSELAFDPDADAGPLDLATLRRRFGDRVDERLPASMRVRLSGRRIADDGPPLPGNFRTQS